MERGPLSLVSTTEQLLGRKVAAPVCKSENTAVGIRRSVGRSVGRSVDIIRSRTQATELLLVLRISTY
jgi:hypothetical protein